MFGQPPPAMPNFCSRHTPCAVREHEAQDAFQATFLVLAQKAKSLCVRESLGPWIHSVAYRVASCACAAAIRRRRHARCHGELAAGRLAVYQDDPGQTRPASRSWPGRF